MNDALRRARAFGQRFGLARPVLQAPMAGVPSLALARAVVQGGGMASVGALLLAPAVIAEWAARFAEAGGGPLQMNLWVPDPPPRRDAAQEAALRAFLAQHGPAVPEAAADAPLQDFAAQCEALLAARPAAVSSIMGLFPAPFVAQLKAAGIAWFANVTGLAEARAALAAGADVLVAQGAEAGGHRGAFDAATARDAAVGLFALLPQVAALAEPAGVPVVATGGIADARGMAAALLLGASAVQVGTALLRCPEAGIAPAWAAGLAGLAPERTQLTRAFSGRWGRAITTEYVCAAAAPDAPAPAPYPVQRALTACMRQAAEAAGDLQHLQAWAGQGAALATGGAAAAWVAATWDAAEGLLGAGRGG